MTKLAGTYQRLIAYTKYVNDCEFEGLEAFPMDKWEKYVVGSPDLGLGYELLRRDKEQES